MRMIGAATLSAVMLLAGISTPAQTLPDPERLPLRGYFEPSGIVQLADGRLVLVEDEKGYPVSVLTFDGDGGFTGRTVKLKTLSGVLRGRTKVGRLDDLEAVTLGAGGYIYAITSHSLTPPGNRFTKREKLVRFRLEGTRAVDIALVLKLRDEMAGLHKKIARAAGIRNAGDDDHLSVEGMAYDPGGARLLIGMRGPTIRGMSVVLALSDLDSAFDGTRPARFESDLILLDLDRGGIRAMAYDPRLNGFLILSRREKAGKGFKLWLWDGTPAHKPRRIRLKGAPDLSKAEGVTPVRRDQTDQIMIVFDSGRKSRGRSGEYMLVSYDQLEIAPPKPTRK